MEARLEEEAAACPPPPSPSPTPFLTNPCSPAAADTGMCLLLLPPPPVPLQPGPPLPPSHTHQHLHQMRRRRVSWRRRPLPYRPKRRQRRGRQQKQRGAWRWTAAGRHTRHRMGGWVAQGEGDKERFRGRRGLRGVQKSVLGEGGEGDGLQQQWGGSGQVVGWMAQLGVGWAGGWRAEGPRGGWVGRRLQRHPVS